MLLRAVAAQGWDPQKDVNIIAQAPEIAGSALRSNRSTPMPTSCPSPSCSPTAASPARSTTAPRPTRRPSTALVDADYAKKYPEVVTAYLRASLEADRLLAAEPEKYSELIERSPASRPR
jgi:NitT/TauT family transport system substrate-binding protein